MKCSEGSAQRKCTDKMPTLIKKISNQLPNFTT